MPNPPDNGSLLIVCAIIDAIMALVQKAETGAVFNNARKAAPVQQNLVELGHVQAPMLLQLDNKSAVGITNDTIKQGKSNPTEMRFYWLKDKERQKQFNVCWKEGATNKGDYPTKHHPIKHHQAVRPQYVLNMMQYIISNLSSHNPSQKKCHTTLRKGVLKSSRLYYHRTVVT